MKIKTQKVMIEEVLNDCKFLLNDCLTEKNITHLDLESLRILHIIDSAFLSLFILELLLKALAYRKNFFRDPWRTFDFVIVGIAVFPANGVFSVLRALRVLRTLRMISVVPSLRRVVSGLLTALPGLASVASIMLLIFYVAAVMATKLFGTRFPQWFGKIGDSAYTFFK